MGPCSALWSSFSRTCLTKLCWEMARGHPCKVPKLPKLSPLNLEAGFLRPAALQRNLISVACTHNLILSVTVIDKGRDIDCTESFVYKLCSCFTTADEHNIAVSELILSKGLVSLRPPTEWLPPYTHFTWPLSFIWQLVCSQISRNRKLCIKVSVKLSTGMKCLLSLSLGKCWATLGQLFPQF